MHSSAQQVQLVSEFLFGWHTVGDTSSEEARVTPFAAFKARFRNPTPEATERFYTAFRAADVGRKNHLTLSEFRSALVQGLGLDLTPMEVRSYFHNADENGDGVVDIDEFLTIMQSDEEE